MSGSEELLSRVASKSHEGVDLSPEPRERVAIVACMDARLNPHEIFCLQPGDAHVIRNAGGTVTDDTIRSLVISQRLLGTEEVLLLHHTKCGMTSIDEEDFLSKLTAEAGQAPPWQLGAFDDVDLDVRQSMRLIRESPFLTCRDQVRGFVYDVSSGGLREVR